MRPARGRTRAGARRAGLSLIEALIVLGLLAVAIGKVVMILRAADRTNKVDSAAMAIEDQARHVLDQVCYSIIGAARETLIPDPQSPTFDTELTYRVSLGMEDGELVLGDVERIGLGGSRSQLTWTQNPETKEEMRVVWCNVLRPYFAGEIPNGADDNDNGLIDETGLTFTLDRDAVTVRVMLERTNSDGTTVSKHVESTITCRN